MRAALFSILVTFALASVGLAQSPLPVIVPAAQPGVTVKASPPPATADSTPAILKMLQEMKAANEETLRKQTATLEQLDELEKAAEQIRIFSKRG